MPTALRVQTDRAIEFMFKEQTDHDVNESGTGAEKLRFAASSGFEFAKTRIPSRESRNDGKRRRGRDGNGAVEFALNNDLIIGAYNTPIDAVLRGTATAAATKTQAEIGAQLTATGAVVTFSGGTAITAGVRKGQIHVYTAGLATADLNTNLIVIAATETTITYHRSLTTVGSAADFSFSIKRNTIQAATDRIFTGEERRINHDRSELCRMFRWGSWGMSAGVNQNIDINFTGMGAEKTLLATGDSPNFSSPTEATGIGLVAPNARMYIVGLGFLRVSAWNFEINQNLTREESTDQTPYEIIPGQPTFNIGFTTIESVLDYEEDYLTEEVLEGFLLIEEPVSSGAKPAVCVWFNEFTLFNPRKSGAGADRSSTRSYAIDPDINEDGGANLNTNIVWSTTV